MPIVPSARRQRALLLSSAVLLLPSLAAAQTATELPAITVTQTRLFDRTLPAPTIDAPVTPARRRDAPPAAAAAPAPGATPTAEPAPVAAVGITGAATTVITAAEIARSPAQSVPEIIGQVPGVQLTSLYGGVNGTGTSVDLRGFGATATSNTLILINGRRLNDLDIQGVDLSAIPRDSIARIEVTRGNSAAVLYGDNAVGGVVNIVTKTGVGVPTGGRFEAGVGSFGQKLASVSGNWGAGPWSAALFGTLIRSDGYRVNNALEQQSGIGEIRYTTPDLSAFITLSGDDRHLGFPGGRLVNPATGVNELATNRRGTSTPRDYGDQQGQSVTAGFSKTVLNGVELIVDGGIRAKQQQAMFFSNFGNSAVDSELLTASFTPRLRITNPVFGLPSTILTGIDVIDAGYNSRRGTMLGGPPINVYDLNQLSVAGYFQQTLGVLPSTDISYGARIQRLDLTARNRLDPTAPGFFGGVQALPLDTQQTNNALHLGFEHRVSPGVAVFGRVASAFRTPNVDERVASGPSFDPITFAPLAQTFTLKTQTSRDVEGGVRFDLGAVNVQTSAYAMLLNNELQYDAVQFFNRNLDPTKRLGTETTASWRVAPDLAFRGGFAVTQATFREGPFAGKEVPLVSRYTGNFGVSYNIWQQYVVFDATARIWSDRRMANDNNGVQPVIPGNATVDVKLSGQVDRFFWSASVNNLFNTKYYDYAVASAFTPGAFSAYPLPGRNFLVKAGVTF